MADGLDYDGLLNHLRHLQSLQRTIQKQWRGFVGFVLLALVAGVGGFCFGQETLVRRDSDLERELQSKHNYSPFATRPSRGIPNLFARNWAEENEAIDRRYRKELRSFEANQERKRRAFYEDFERTRQSHFAQSALPAAVGLLAFGVAQGTRIIRTGITSNYFRPFMDRSRMRGSAVLPQSEQELAFGRVSGNTLAEVQS